MALSSFATIHIFLVSMEWGFKGVRMDNVEKMELNKKYDLRKRSSQQESLMRQQQ